MPLYFFMLGQMWPVPVNFAASMAGAVSEKIGVFASIFISTFAEYYFPAKLYQLSMFVLISYILFINLKIMWKIICICAIEKKQYIFSKMHVLFSGANIIRIKEGSQTITSSQLAAPVYTCFLIWKIFPFNSYKIILEVIISVCYYYY